MTDIKYYKVTKEAYNAYKYGVGGNKDLDAKTIINKLSRNISLSIPEKIDEFTTRHHYGNLKIDVLESKNLIIKVKNTYKCHKKWWKDEQKFKTINKKLNIPMEVV